MRAERSVAMEATTTQFRRAEPEVLDNFLRRGASACDVVCAKVVVARL